MADPITKPPPAAPPPAADRVAESRLAPQMAMMARTFWASSERNHVLLLGLGLVAVIGVSAFGQVRLNAWNQPFYDALSHKNLSGFLSQLMVFGVIAGGLLILNVAQAWLNQMTKVRLREGLVRDLINEWLKPRRAFHLVNAGEMGTNPDQRIHEDARHLTELSTDLGVGLLQASLLLGSFIGVLWILSQNVTFHLSGHNFAVPGYMVWCALIYAGTASWLSWRVGSPLINLNSERYSREADLRFALVRLNEHTDSITLSGGEQDERKRLNIELERVLDIMRRIVSATTRLTWITAGYGWFTLIAPILVAAPGYFGGDLTFGGLMMVVGAFIQVQGSLRWFIDNFSTLADWRATLLRIASFRQTVLTMDGLGATSNRIEFEQTKDGRFIFEHLEVATPTGCTSLSEQHVEIAPGEHVLIVGEAGTGKTMLFRAIAGLWPWGGGRIGLPSPEQVMFMPRQPYVPLGTLRAALAYPSVETAFKDEELVSVLKSASLEHLSSSLDRTARWDRELTDDEQQYLVFARIVLHKPRWVVIDEVLDALDDDARDRVINLFNAGLKDAAIINIGRPETQHRFFERVLHLIKDPRGVCFVPSLDPVAPASNANLVKTT
ncbi:MAG: vitamin B12/bleomycin/antimicrobial peptide transport system ATP-binding/permease protein [Verrucomicrobiota bacterium]